MKVAMVMGLIAIALVGLGIPSAAALDGPTPPELADPVKAGTYPEIQVLSLNGATAGTFLMRVDTSCSWTSPIAYDASAAGVDTAISGTIAPCLGGAWSADVAGADGGPWTITISGTSTVNLAEFSLDSSGLTGGAPDVNTVQDGATLAADDVAPHGGYSSMTDYCLQCHQVHVGYPYTDVTSEYALMADNNVTSTCATCHGYLGVSPTGAEIPGFPGVAGTASSRSVYTSDPIHNIGYSASRYEAAWTYGWGAGGPTAPSTRRAGAGVASTYGGGFYCGTCHTPHGEFGQLINSKWVYTTAGTGTSHVAEWKNDTAIYWDNPNASGYPEFSPMYLHQTAGGSWEVCTAVAGGGTCYPAQTRDAEGQLVSLYGYKLLSYVPNHQYPTRSGSTYPQPDGSSAALPPGGMWANAPFSAGTLARVAGSPYNVVNTRILLGTLGAAITSTDGSFSVTATSGSTLGTETLPFKIRIDDEIITVTGRAGTGPYTLTVTRSGENAEQPWMTNAAAAHNANAEVLLVPTILVNEASANALKPPGSSTAVKLPFHVKFGNTGSTEVAVVQGRTAVSSVFCSVPDCYLYTVGRAVDGTAQSESHAAGSSVLIQSGTSVATVKSWGVDMYDHDAALWCGTCHNGSVDASFGGQWHSHPTGCTACHGNPADGSSADFPHSSTDEFMLKEVPDALCLECHIAGSLP